MKKKAITASVQFDNLAKRNAEQEMSYFKKKIGIFKYAAATYKFLY